MNINKIIKAIIPFNVLVFMSWFFPKNILCLFRKSKDYFSVRENSVLLMEFYLVHGETLPGYIQYLLDLNYNVDVVLCKPAKKGRNDLGLFFCFDHNEKVRVKTLSAYEMNFLLRSDIAAKYKHIIINSFNDGLVLSHLCFVNLKKIKPVCVIHNPNMYNKYFQTNKIISIVKIESFNREPPLVVNPHYFGEIHKKDKSKKTIFAAINSKELFRRNIFLLFEACEMLYKKGIYDFSVKIFGRGFPIPERYRDNIQDFGFIDFKNMFKEIEDSDFFLALIDQESTPYTNKASGSFQISYGYLKPIVLHGKFSDVSGLNDLNSVIYNDNAELADAMEKCICMPNNDYLTLINALENTQKELYKMSVNNLKTALETTI